MAAVAAACSGSTVPNGSKNGVRGENTPDGGKGGAASILDSGIGSAANIVDDGTGGGASIPDQPHPPANTGGRDGIGGGENTAGSVGESWKVCTAATDTTHDPDNCGSCGNRCDTIVVGSGHFAPQRIVVDAANAYIAAYGVTSDDGSVLKVALDGGNPITLATTHYPAAIAVDGTSAYWTNPVEGTLVKVPKGGGTPTTLASDLAQPQEIALDGTNVYFSTQCFDDAGTCSRGGAITKVPKAGGVPVALATGLDWIQSIAVDGNDVYWSSGGVTIFDSKVMKVSRDGGPPITLAAGLHDVRNIAVDHQNVYFTESDNQADGGGEPVLMKVPVGGGAPTELARIPFTQFVAVDATSIYAANESIIQVPIGGGEPTVLARGLHMADFAVGATNVYWGSFFYGDGTIMKLGPKTCENGTCQCPGDQVVCFGKCVARGAACSP